MGVLWGKGGEMLCSSGVEQLRSFPVTVDFRAQAVAGGDPWCRMHFKKRKKMLFADMALALIFTHPHIIFLL